MNINVLWLFKVTLKWRQSPLKSKLHLVFYEEQIEQNVNNARSQVAVFLFWAITINGNPHSHPSCIYERHLLATKFHMIQTLVCSGDYTTRTPFLNVEKWVQHHPAA